MRLVCEYAATLARPRGASQYADNSFAERIGWREMFTGDWPASSLRLTSYPQDLLSQPLNVGSVRIRFHRSRRRR